MKTKDDLDVGDLVWIGDPALKIVGVYGRDDDKRLKTLHFDKNENPIFMDIELSAVTHWQSKGDKTCWYPEGT